VARGDKPETQFVIRPDHAVCVNANAADEYMVAISSIRDLQLILMPPQYPQLRPQLGKHVRLEGSLFPASTGHHHTPVMLSDVVTVEAGGS
jgi:hypothetical protein